MRYAIYYLPPTDTRLWQFGSSVLGYDSVSRRELTFPDHALFQEAGAESLSSEPRRYGFHATLKAPFALAGGVIESALLSHAASFAGRRKPFVLPPLTPATLGQFIALVPSEKSAALDELAAACVREFDPIRAPLSEAELARRIASPLTPRQIGYLEEWGYPYVFSDFRFHMTLTGPLHAGTRAHVLQGLTSLYAPIAEPLVVDAITVVRQPSRDSRFEALARFPFAACTDD